MKKLYMGFVLLFGFLIFVPHIAAATRITLSPEQEQEVKKQVQKNLNCLNERKAKLPVKYEGPNLKLTTIPRYFGISNISTGTDIKYYIDSVAIAEINGRNKDRFDEQQLKHMLSKKYTMKGGILGEGCTEYIHICHNDGYAGFWAYDVTNVPPNSYLKYIPETSEMQVITPADKKYKKFMDEYKKSEKLPQEERLQEKRELK